MLKNNRSCAVDGLAYNGCSCCNTSQPRRRAKKSAKAKDSEPWKLLARRKTSDGY